MFPSLSSRLSRRLGKTSVAFAATLALGSLVGTSQADAARDSASSIRAKKASPGLEALAAGAARDLVRIRGDVANEVGKDVISFEPSKSKGGKSGGEKEPGPKYLDPGSVAKYKVHSPSGSSGASPIPEPASVFLLAAGSLIVGGAVRRRL